MQWFFLNQCPTSLEASKGTTTRLLIPNIASSKYSACTSKLNARALSVVVHPKGFEPLITDPKSVVISISPRVRLNFCSNAVSARNVSSAEVLTKAGCMAYKKFTSICKAILLKYSDNYTTIGQNHKSSGSSSDVPSGLGSGAPGAGGGSLRI